MKHGISIFFRFLAVLVVIFLGITAAMPQSTTKDDKTVFPIWNDVNEENRDVICDVYERGILAGGANGEFGVGEALTAKEAAYATVRMYEYETKRNYSFGHYNSKDGEKYISKAKAYKIWDKRFPEADATMSRQEFIAVLAKHNIKSKKLNDSLSTAMLETLKYKKESEKMYRLGIMLDTNITESFSEEIMINRLEAAKLILMYIEEERRIKIVMPDYESMEKVLTEKMSEFHGDWSLYFEDCKTGHQISINSHQVYSASLIKLFVAQTVYERASAGDLVLTQQVENEIYKMITYSDNEAWKYLARKLGGGSYSKGMESVTKAAQASGYADTGQFYKGSHKNYNFTSVNDCGAFLRNVLNGTMVNEQYSEKLLSLLKQQQHLHKIPSGVPDSITTANKTGELDYMQGDAAIVYAPNGTYILVIIGDSLSNGYGQISNFTNLSETVYQFLN